jgi:uncharacterized protein with HEPN domain
MKENRDNLFLERLMESIDKIESHVSGYDLDRFANDLKTYDAVLMQFVNIGEMINRLSNTFREAHDQMTWHAAIGMRNEITHGYFNIKPEIVWKTIKDDLPPLKADITKILNK